MQTGEAGSLVCGVSWPRPHALGFILEYLGHPGCHSLPGMPSRQLLETLALWTQRRRAKWHLEPVRVLVGTKGDWSPPSPGCAPTSFPLQDVAQVNSVQDGLKLLL